MAPRRRGPSPSRPSTGPATAPASRVAVSIHWAALRETCCSRATVGTMGAPSVLTTETVSAVNISEGRRNRRRPVSLRRPSMGALSACGTAMCGVSFRWGFWHGGSEGDDLH